MSDLFRLIWSNGLSWGFVSGFSAFFLGKAVKSGLALFKI